MPPHTPGLEDFYQCLADGSPGPESSFLHADDLKDPATPFLDDDALRVLIHKYFYQANGRRLEKELPNMLPHLPKSIFAHADIAPHNILVDNDGQITGIIDWELAGWYTECWEYANITKPIEEKNRQAWMGRTAPREWDLSGIVAARRILF